MRTVGGTVGLSTPDVYGRGRGVVRVGDWGVGGGDGGERESKGRRDAQEPEEQAEAEAGGHGGGCRSGRVCT